MAPVYGDKALALTITCLFICSILEVRAEERNSCSVLSFCY